MKQLEQARVLLAKAREDQQAALALLQHPEVGDAVIGFHCQQAAEKLLKALLSARSVAFRHTHNLSRLIRLLDETGHAFPADLRGLVRLTRFAVQFRYDLYEEEPDLDREAALGLIRRLRAFVEKEVSTV